MRKPSPKPVYTDRVETPFGVVTLTSDGEALTGLSFADREPTELLRATLPVFEQTRRWLSLYCAGRDPGFVPRLAPCATPFQQAVRTLLLSVPYGSTVTYGALAKTLDTSARAIGSAVGRNPILLIVPCHRVVGADGSLVGFAAGTDRKRRLLTHEQMRGQ